VEVAFVYRAFQTENVKCPLWQPEKKSVDAVYCCVVFSAAARVLKKPHYEAFRLWVVFLGPFSRVAQIPEIWAGRMRFCTMALASYQTTGAKNFDVVAIFFVGGGWNFCTFSFVKEPRP
jgi:hypothetical protein